MRSSSPFYFKRQHLQLRYFVTFTRVTIDLATVLDMTLGCSEPPDENVVTITHPDVGNVDSSLNIIFSRKYPNNDITPAPSDGQQTKTA
ncbi:hypothetical protein CEXT_631281 [Caerostris extrusa]|uniref:Uncharacterized protein n=1 Tax=Caerostris extrusa TaxID=172846 RepID=A0AAV4N7J6_CAEEX|nr:hypothetical protein CEXT_631281 [Caerostris extrusa]